MADRSERLPLTVRVGLPLLVLLVALLFGSGVIAGKPQTQAQRVAALESVVRCPSCIDVSVAQSEESTALAVRHEIVRQVAQGRSDGQIEQTLVSQYGETILLAPPDSGGFTVIWLAPVVLGVGALGVFVVLFWRRSRQFATTRIAQITVDTTS